MKRKAVLKRIYRGTKKWEHRNILTEIYRLEAVLDSLQQKYPAEKKLSIALGIVRSVAPRLLNLFKQKKLK